MLARFGDHPRAPDAMLNIGLAQLESGDRRAARATLQTLVDRHPDTPAAQIARERLAALR
jgi:TolA-binding protein